MARKPSTESTTQMIPHPSPAVALVAAVMERHEILARAQQLRQAYRIYEACVWRRALLTQTGWIELIFGFRLWDDLTVWAKPERSEGWRLVQLEVRPLHPAGLGWAWPGGARPGAARPGMARHGAAWQGKARVFNVDKLPSLAFSFLIAFFQSAQFQTIVRSALKMGGLWLYLHVVPIADQTAAAQLEFINQVIGGGLIAWGLILSMVVHAGHGTPATGTSGGPISVTSAK